MSWINLFCYIFYSCHGHIPPILSSLLQTKMVIGQNSKGEYHVDSYHTLSFLRFPIHYDQSLKGSQLHPCPLVTLSHQLKVILSTSASNVNSRIGFLDVWLFRRLTPAFYQARFLLRQAVPFEVIVEDSPCLQRYPQTCSWMFDHESPRKSRV